MKIVIASSKTLFLFSSSLSIGRLFSLCFCSGRRPCSGCVRIKVMGINVCGPSENRGNGILVARYSELFPVFFFFFIGSVKWNPVLPSSNYIMLSNSIIHIFVFKIFFSFNTNTFKTILRLKKIPKELASFQILLKFFGYRRCEII